MAVLTAKTRYGLKAMIHLAETYSESWTQGADIARSQHIPKKFLDSILQELKIGGLLHSKKGKGGGYFLARPPAKIALGEIIRVLDGPIAPIACASRLNYRPCSDCHDESLCKIRSVMLRVRESTAAVLDNTNLLSMIEGSGGPAILYYDI